MKIQRIIKISTITILSLILLTGLSIAALITFVNPNNYKPLIIKAVDDSTARRLSLDGNISWKLWPYLGLHIEKISLSNPPEFTDPNLVSINFADVSVQLLPLLNHSIIINNLTLDGLNLALIKNGELNNWTFTSTKESKTNNEPNTPTKPAKPMHLALNTLVLTDSTVTYTDLKDKLHYAINNFDFLIKANHGGEISFDQQSETLTLKQVEFNFSNIIKGNTNLTLSDFSNLKYIGNIDIKPFSLSQLLNKVNYPLEAIKNKSLFNSISFATDLKGDKSKLSLDKTTFTLGQSLKGNLTVVATNLNTSPQYTGNINLPEFSLNNVLDGLNIATQARVKNKLFNQFTLQTKFNGTKDSLSLQQLGFNFPGFIKGNVNVSVHNFTNPNYTGDASIPTFSLNQVMEQAGMKAIDIPNKQFLNQVAVSTNFTGGTNNINLSSIVAKISNSNATGNLNVISITPLKFNQQININKLELSDIVNTYGYKLPLTGVHTTGNTSIADSKNLATLNATQNVNIDNITVSGFDLDHLVGQLDQALTSATQAVSVDNLQHLDNTLKVVNTIKNMQATIDKAKGAGQKDYSQKTNLGNLNANTVIKNGIANPATFKLSGPSLKTNGQGTINLVNKNLNYTVTTQLITKQTHDILNQLTFPYTAHGKINDINGSLDWGSIQKQILGYYMKNTQQQVKSMVKDQATQLINSQVPNDTSGIKQGITNAIGNLFK